MTMPFTITAPAWFDQAVCAGISDPDVFFPVQDKRRYQEQIAMTREMCGVCPVQDRCLDLALNDPSLEGIWAGTTETDRRNIRRNQRNIA